MDSTRAPLIAAAVLCVGVAAFAVPPIPQDPAYHAFADAAPWLGVPNALNVGSNLPFVAVGVAGLVELFRPRNRGRATLLEPCERWPYAIFFLGVLLTGVGSGFYHLAPDTERLFWDRIPMTIAFMGLVSATLAERVDARVGLGLLAPLVVAGAATVVYWRWSERCGAGDLRPYALVQYGGLLALVLLAAVYRSRHPRGDLIWWTVALYGLAKWFEYVDGEVLRATRVVSGHTLKHLVSAVAAFLVVRMLRARSVGTGQGSARSAPPLVHRATET